MKVLLSLQFTAFWRQRAHIREYLATFAKSNRIAGIKLLWNFCGNPWHLLITYAAYFSLELQRKVEGKDKQITPQKLIYLILFLTIKEQELWSFMCFMQIGSHLIQRFFHSSQLLRTHNAECWWYVGFHCRSRSRDTNGDIIWQAVQTIISSFAQSSSLMNFILPFDGFAIQ